MDLDPDYQRGAFPYTSFLTSVSEKHSGAVWSESRQSGLIDSLLHRIFVPPIIVGK